jgi:hypothetical protein
MMKNLGLREEDLDDVIFEEEPTPPPESTRWLAIARVHTSREYSDFWLYKNLRSAWDLAQEVKIRSLDKNMYTMQFHCLGDWDKVMEGGPWVFRGHPVILAPYDGFTKPSEIPLNKFKIWIQIHDLPDGFKPMLGSLAAKVGEVVVSEPVSGDFPGNFFRVRVWLYVLKPLKNHVSMIRAQRRQIFLVKYERLPDWCAFCGMIGHLYTEHGDGIHPSSSLVFKDLKATWAIRSAGRGRGRGRGFGSSRGGFTSGSGSFFEERTEEEEKDAMSEDDPELNRKRTGDGRNNASLPAPLGETATKDALAGSNIGGKVDAIVNSLEAYNPPSPNPVRDPKRKKTTEEEGSNVNSTLAGSMEGRRLDQ